MKKRFSTMVLAGAALLVAATGLGAQSKTIEGESVTVTTTIVAIEQGTRTMTVKDDQGVYETIVAPEAMKRFSELKVGDKITARYYENLVVRLKKPDEPAVDLDTGGITRNNAGATPGGTAAAQRTITATVTAIDPKTSALTVTGPNGWKYSRKVTDKKALAQLKVGDRLDMTWTDALLISVEPAK